MLVQAQSGLPVRWLRSKVRPHNKSFKGTALRLRLRAVPLTPALANTSESVPVIQTVAIFAAGVFAVWCLPAAKAAIIGDAGPRVAAMLAGVVVALPISVLASAGSLAGFLVAKSSAQVVAWQSLAAADICGILTQVVTRTPEAPSRAFQVASRVWLGVPVLLRVLLAGAIIGFILGKVTKLQNTSVG